MQTTNYLTQKSTQLAPKKVILHTSPSNYTDRTLEVAFRGTKMRGKDKFGNYITK
jgi:hypothetical protein